MSLLEDSVVVGPVEDISADAVKVAAPVAPRDGRFWKSPPKERSSAIIKDNKGAKSKGRISDDIKSAKKFERKIREAARDRVIAEAERIAKQQKRRIDGELKAGGYVKVNPEKVAKMSKRQLRSIRRKSVNPDGSVSFTSVH